MMKHEFEELAGYEVSNEDYDKVIEPMYMATNLSKQEFVKCLDRKRFALPTRNQVIREMKKVAAHLFDICGHCTDYESEQKLDDMAKAYAKRFHGIDWSRDSESYVFFNRGYEYPNMRGCSYPEELVIGRGSDEYERIVLVK